MREQIFPRLSQAQLAAAVVSVLWFGTLPVQAEVSSVAFKTTRNVKYL